jgi:hypothetical protein
MPDPDKPSETGEQRDDFRDRTSRLAEQMGLEIPVRRDHEPPPDMNALIRAARRRHEPRRTEGDK